MDLDDPNIDLYDLAQCYCAETADLATVGDSKPHAVGAVICTVCQSETHDSAECPTRKQLARELNEANRAKSSIKEFLVGSLAELIRVMHI